MNNTNKIVVIGVKYDSNLGDLLLGDCFCYLLSREIPNANIDYIDMRGRIEADKNEYINSFLNNLYKHIRHVGGKILRSCISQKSLHDEAYLNEFFEKHISNASVVIFAGGGIIEYKHYNSDLYIKAITNIAKRHSIPVVFNAVGMLDRYDPQSNRAQDLRSILQSDNVRFVGVRENVAWMEEWVDHKRNIQLICDPACFAAEAYGVSKDKDSQLVGIGLIRPNIFRDFGENYSDNEIADIYAHIIHGFLSKGYKCELFTNGYKGDISLADLMCNRHKELSYLKDSIKNPNEAKDLVETISKYRMIFSSRMHSAIISYSLGIPCGTLSWADKIKAFYENIGHPERCFYPRSVEPLNVIRVLTKAYEGEVDTGRREYLSSSLIPLEIAKLFYQT